MSLWDDGQNEALKCAVHGASCVLMAEQAAYNLAVWRSGRGRCRHLFAGSVYLVITILECVQVSRHIRDKS